MKMFTYIHSLNVKGQETVLPKQQAGMFLVICVILFDLKYLVNDTFILIFH